MGKQETEMVMTMMDGDGSSITMSNDVDERMEERESKQRYPRYKYTKRVVFGKERVTSLFHSPKR